MGERADSRVPVTKERLRQLNDLKDVGETYDELLEDMIHVYERLGLADRARDVREMDAEELVELGNLE